MEVNKHYEIRGYTSEDSNVLTIGLKNKYPKPIKATVDCSQSKNMVYSVLKGRVVRTVEPGQVEFMLHLEPAPGAKEFQHDVAVEFVEDNS